MSSVDLSIIVAVYNEEECIERLHEMVVEAIEPLKISFELIFVDDGSRDATFILAKRIAVRDPRVRVIKFRRNYGQTPAMVAGIEHARGSVLVTMDGDLQNDPADIPDFLRKIDEGYDLVAGWRQRRQDKLLTRVLPSKVANWLIAWVTGVRIKDNGCSLKAYRAELIKNIPLYSEMHRFIPAMTSLAGARIAEIPVRHHARQFGVSKYGISRVYKVLLDLLSIKTVLLLATRPLFSFGGTAIAAALLALMLFVLQLLYPLLFGGSANVVMASLGLLCAALAMFLGALGLLAQLVYKTGDLDAADFSGLTANLVREDHGPNREPRS